MTDASTKRLILGTAGHIDHGKTTLVKALTGTDTDRLTEERKRGMSIELGFARWRLADDLEADIIDVPGHEMFVGTMTSGASGIEAALLVVSVEDGVMPQTREHLRVLEHLGVHSLIVVLSKCDLADEEIIEWQRDELTSFFDTQTLKPIDIVEVSAQTGHGLDILCQCVQKIARTNQEPQTDQHTIMAIDRSFNLAGKGRVLAGTLRAGRLERDASVYLLSQADDTVFEAPIKSLHRHGDEISNVHGPTRLAMTLRGKDIKPLERGDWISSQPMVYSRCALVFISGSFLETDLRSELEFHCGTFTRQVRLKGAKLSANSFAIFDFDRPCWLRGGLRFILRQQNQHGKETVGGGLVADAQQPKFKGVYRGVDALNREDNERAVLKFITLGARVDSLTHEALAIRFSNSIARLVSRALKNNDYRDLKTNDGLLAPSSHLRDAQEAIFALIQSELKARPEAKGLPESVIYSKLSRWSRPELQHAVKLGIERERFGRSQGLLRVKTALETTTKGESTLFHKVKSQLLACGITPPTVPELARELKLGVQDVRDVIQKLHHHSEVVKLAPDLYADITIAQTMIPRVVSALSAVEALTAAELKPYLAEGISRKWAIPWLEYLDKSKVTVRRGNQRILHPSRKGP